MQDDTLNLYTDVHHGAKMGVESIDALIKNSDSKEFKQKLLETQNEYKEIAREADEAIQRRGEIPKEIGIMSKVMTQGMVTMSAMFDDSEKKQSQMLKKGFDMAVEELSHSIEKNKDAEENARKLAFDLLRMQQRELKKYKEYMQ